MRSVLKFKSPRIRISDYVEAFANDILHAVRKQGLEGIIGKRKDSFYAPGKRSGAWVKYHGNRGQELVIGDYVPGPHGLDSVIVGYYKRVDLIYVARVRNGFVPGLPASDVRKAALPGHPGMSIRQSARDASLALG
jgi:bifunctional non-homologous end joining protein LigD